LAVCAASALEKELTDQMVQSARNIQRDASDVRLSLKSKKTGAQDVQAKLEAMSADLAKLQELVMQFDSTRTALSDRDRADWLKIKEKVQLLEIFHGQKQKLVAEDFARNRTLIQAHAKGVAFRAKSLEETAAKLQREALP
jgi:hypothetical protein